LHVTPTHMHVCSTATNEQHDLHVFTSTDMLPLPIVVNA